MRIVVVSQQAASVLDVLRAKLPGCEPEAAASLEAVPAELPADTVVLLDLEDGETGMSAARELRSRGVRTGIVVIGTDDTGDLPAVIGVTPPIRVRQLSDAFRRAWVEQRRMAAEQVAAAPPGGEPSNGTVIPARLRSARKNGPPASPVRRGAPAVALGIVQDVEDDGARSGPVSQGGSGAAERRGSGGAAAGGAAPGGAGSGAGSSGAARSGAARSGAASDAGAPGDAGEGGLEEKVAAVLEATGRVEAIAASLPAVGDPVALDRAVVVTVVQAFGADTVGLWHRRPDGWYVAAHYGLSPRQASQLVAPEQPVMAELESTGGALLLEPVASFPSMMKGLGGGYEGSFMAAAIAVGQYHLGILTVGREAPLAEVDLDKLVDLAREAALGIGVARHIDRMHDLAEEGRALARADEPPAPVPVPAAGPAAVRRTAKGRRDDDFDTQGVIIQLPDHLHGRA